MATRSAATHTVIWVTRRAMEEHKLQGMWRVTLRDRLQDRQVGMLLARALRMVPARVTALPEQPKRGPET